MAPPTNCFTALLMVIPTRHGIYSYVLYFWSYKKKSGNARLLPKIGDTKKNRVQCVLTPEMKMQTKIDTTPENEYNKKIECTASVLSQENEDTAKKSNAIPENEDTTKIRHRVRAILGNEDTNKKSILPRKMKIQQKNECTAACIPGK